MFCAFEMKYILYEVRGCRLTSHQQDTIEKVVKMGCRVKMITGDHLAIGKETGRRLGLGTNMLTTKDLTKDMSPSEKIHLIENSDGFAEVFPEHKVITNIPSVKCFLTQSALVRDRARVAKGWTYYWHDW